MAGRLWLLARTARDELRNRRLSREEVFTRIYREHRWGDAETRSGTGSKLERTAAVRRVLPVWLRRYGIASLLDVPCGDFNWMQHVDLGETLYVGADVVRELVEENQRRFGGPGRRFVRLDLAEEPLPAADAVLCRDGLVHLRNRDAAAALRNITSSGARYLLATTFRGVERNQEIVTGFFRPVDLRLPPFGLAEPLEVVDEETVGGGRRGSPVLVKQLGLWNLGGP